MDALTHAALGASLAWAAVPPRQGLSRRECLGLGAVAGAFPDVDFALFPLDPLRFLADWHQGPTHSLVLLPLWAAALAGAFCAVRRRAAAFAPAMLVSALAIASHIAADLITAYGTALLHPLSTRRWSLGLSYVIDPLFTAIVVVGLAVGLRTGRRGPAWAGLAVLCLYVGAQAGLQQRALDEGRAAASAQGIQADSWAALAQPFSPFNWKLLAADGAGYHEAHLNLAGHPPLVPSWPGLPRVHELAAAYRPREALDWRRLPRFGDAPHRALAEQLWGDPRFAPFRRFAVYPSVSRVDEEVGGGACVWFTDRRYDLPALADTFRYGFCRVADAAPWELYRLRYFSESARQRLD